jgi:hypothetical protein
VQSIFARQDRRPRRSWAELSSAEALDRGIPFPEIRRQGVRESLFRSLERGVYQPIRSALGPVPVGWYGNQDASWVGYFDTIRRLGLAAYPPEFDEWVALTRAGGWWWPGEHECVVAGRPAVLRVTPVPESWHSEVRLATEAPSPAVVYRDRWSVRPAP